jgi:hypothetical protein
MRRLLSLFVPALALTVIWCGVTRSQASRVICPLREVRAGQRAVGKTVFRGTKIESFNMEIIGVLRKYEGTRSVIVARILDGPVVTRHSGIIMGMSGSPVYIGGRLAGAIAYAWGFDKEPIAGITPIEEMLEAWQVKLPDKSETMAGAGALTSSVVVNGKKVNRVRMGSPDAKGPEAPGTATLIPVGGCLQVSGFSGRAVERLGEFFAQYGMRVAQGSGGEEEQMAPPLVPGAAVGAQLVAGDFDMSALGTVTLAEGNRVLAFGHPLLQMGSVELPMTGGYVYDIQPNLEISSKIMAATKAVGTMYRDYQSGVAGEVGRKAEMLPVSVEVTDKDMERTRRFSLRVVRIKELMPMLVGMSTLTAIDEARGRVAKGMARVRLEVEAEGRPALKREEVGYSDSDAAMLGVPVVLQPLATFTDNPLGALKLKRIQVKVETASKRQTASIERLRVAQSRVKEGDTVVLSATVRPYGKRTIEIPMKLALPADLPRGEVRVVVSSGREAESARGSLGAPRPRPVTLEQLIERYLSAGRSQDLVVQAALPRGGASLLGEELPDLPRAALGALRATRPTDLRPAASVLKEVTPTEWVLSGQQMVTLQVESAMGGGPPRVEGPKGPEGPAGPGTEEGGPSEEGSSGDDFGMGMMGTAGMATPFTLAAAGEEEGGEEAAPGKEAKPEKKEAQPAAKPMARAPDTWVHRSKSDYARAKLSGVAVREDGRIRLAPNESDLAQIPADVAWCVAVREGAAYVGTGSRGVIYRVSPKGEVAEFFATGEMNVHDLAFDKDGNLYAGTSPRGKLFRIAPDGKGSVVYDAESTYLWRLVIAPEGTIYAGAGSPARVYAISPKGEGKVFAELPAANVVSLVRTEAGALYAGTANAGVVYRIGADGTATAVCELPADSADALATDAAGNVYAAGSPGGEIYLIPKSGMGGSYCKTEQDTVYGMVSLPSGELVAATGPAGVVLRVGADRKAEVLVRPETGVATAIAESGGAVYVGSSAPCVLRKLGPGYGESGQLESPPLDAERTARWGRIEWSGTAAEGTEVKVETRAGDSPDPKDHWSAWALTVSGAVASPSARYLQYRLTLGTKDAKATPEVQTVSVSRQARNRPPVCSVKAPNAGDWIGKKYTVKWQAQDQDKDTLTYTVSVSADAGKTWKELKKDLTEMQYEWDTSQSKDGRCLVRVVASDARSRPDDPQTAEGSVVAGVDNTAPKLMIYKSATLVGEDRRAQVKGLVTDACSPIRSVEYRVDDGSWQSLPLALVEATLTDYAVTTDPLTPGSHKVEVRGFDAAGNMASDKTEVKVAEPKAEEKKAEQPAQPKVEEKKAEQTAQPKAEEKKAEESVPAQAQ